ncbi:hypothetical protein E4U46_004806 [Claviceps purpurea]|nr:hypothetical protein E4U46_004806 [Claviceps purpurea]
MLIDEAEDYYISKLSKEPKTIDGLVSAVRDRFENATNLSAYRIEWCSTTFQHVFEQNPGVSKIDCLDIPIKFLQKLYRGLHAESTVDTELRGQLEKAVLTEPDCKFEMGDLSGIAYFRRS